MNLTSSQLQKIALARIFYSDARIYILDNPFNHLNSENVSIVEKMLRDRQRQRNK